MTGAEKEGFKLPPEIIDDIGIMPAEAGVFLCYLYWRVKTSRLKGDVLTVSEDEKYNVLTLESNKYLGDFVFACTILYNKVHSPEDLLNPKDVFEFLNSMQKKDM